MLRLSTTTATLNADAKIDFLSEVVVSDNALHFIGGVFRYRDRAGNRLRFDLASGHVALSFVFK